MEQAWMKYLFTRMLFAMVWSLYVLNLIHGFLACQDVTFSSWTYECSVWVDCNKIFKVSGDLIWSLILNERMCLNGPWLGVD